MKTYTCGRGLKVETFENAALSCGRAKTETFENGVNLKTHTCGLRIRVSFIRPFFASRFNIDDSVTSRQLPTLILFKNGKEEIRRPIKAAGQNGKVVPFFFTKVCSSHRSDIYNYLFTWQNLRDSCNLIGCGSARFFAISDHGQWNPKCQNNFTLISRHF